MRRLILIPDNTQLWSQILLLICPQIEPKLIHKLVHNCEVKYFYQLRSQILPPIAKSNQQGYRLTVYPATQHIRMPTHCAFLIQSRIENLRMDARLTEAHTIIEALLSGHHKRELRTSMDARLTAAKFHCRFSYKRESGTSINARLTAASPVLQFSTSHHTQLDLIRQHSLSEIFKNIWH